MAVSLCSAHVLNSVDNEGYTCTGLLENILQYNNHLPQSSN